MCVEFRHRPRSPRDEFWNWHIVTGLSSRIPKTLNEPRQSDWQIYPLRQQIRRLVPPHLNWDETPDRVKAWMTLKSYCGNQDIKNPVSLSGKRDGHDA
jgi:hypothetical protein